MKQARVWEDEEILSEIMTIMLENMGADRYKEFIVGQLDELDQEDFEEVITKSEKEILYVDSPIDQLTEKINMWHDDRSIVPNSSATTQCMKAMSELGELADNIIKHENVKDSIGDVYVCLCSIARLSDTTMEESIAVAYEDIKDRRGTLTPEGNFIKDN